MSTTQQMQVELLHEMNSTMMDNSVIPFELSCADTSSWIA